MNLNEMRAKAKQDNQALMAAASRRLAENAERNKKNKAHYSGRKAACVANRKAANKLQTRIADWTKITKNQGYHKPGSMQFH